MSDQVPLHVVLVAKPDVTEVALVRLVFEVDCVDVDLTVSNSSATFELFVADWADVHLI